ERFEDRAGEAFDDPLQDGALVRVGGPVPGSVGGLEAGHLAVLPHVIVGGVLPAADVVAKDVEAEPVRRVDDGVDDRVAPRGAPAADVIGRPAEAPPPALEGLPADRGVIFTSVVPGAAVTAGPAPPAPLP